MYQGKKCKGILAEYTEALDFEKWHVWKIEDVQNETRTIIHYPAYYVP